MLDLKEKFEAETISASVPVRSPDQPYLKWVEDCAKDKNIVPTIIMQIEMRLRELGYDGELGYPDHSEPESIYLLKAAHTYFVDCQGHHTRLNNYHDPNDGFGLWIHGRGRLWLINDALTQTLTIALHHGYSHASAEAEGNPRQERFDMYRSLKL